ncbi:MAG: hypothetical protein ACPHVH_01100 [Candidatus Kariarchaeum pelagius]
MRYRLNFLFIMLINNIILKVYADDDNENQYEDFGETLGEIGLYFLYFTAIYVVVVYLRRFLKKLIKNIVDEENDSVKDNYITNFKVLIDDFYQKNRKLMLYVHNIAATIVVVITGVHGILLYEKLDLENLTGIIAWIIIVILSVFGYVIYYKFRPIWSQQKNRKFIRYIHRQRWLTILLILFMFIHVN